MEEKELTGAQTAQAALEESSDAGSEAVEVAETSQAVEAPETPEARKARYRALVNGEFKDLYTADTQRIIDRRFKETRSLREALEARQGILDRMMERYGVDDAAALEAAVEAEMDRARTQAAQAAEQRLADHIRVFGARPRENGASAQSAVAPVKDVKALNRAQRAELARRAARGEVITFR